MNHSFINISPGTCSSVGYTHLVPNAPIINMNITSGVWADDAHIWFLSQDGATYMSDFSDFTKWTKPTTAPATASAAPALTFYKCPNGEYSSTGATGCAAPTTTNKTTGCPTETFNPVNLTVSALEDIIVYGFNTG